MRRPARKIEQPDESVRDAGPERARPLKKRVPQFFVEMDATGTFHRLLRAGLEDGLATVVEFFCGETGGWVPEPSLVQAWWFDRSHWRPISMGRALAVLDLLKRHEVPVSIPASEPRIPISPASDVFLRSV